MRRMALLLVLVLAAYGFGARAQQSEEAGDRTVLALRIVERTWADTRRTIETMRDQIAATLPIDQREKFRELLDEYFDFEAYRKLHVSLMTRHFTVAELAALDNFYASPEGQSVMQKMPLVMSEMLPFAQRMILEAIKRSPRDKRPPQLRDF